ncbi:MAG: hypothetical protein ABIE74_10365 [Pseudomonadota bacterium]
MKLLKLTSFLLVILLFSSCEGSGGGLNSPDFNNSNSPSNSDDSETIVRTDLKEFIFHIGPIDLKPNTDPTEMLDKPLTMKFQVGEPVWVIGFKPAVVDGLGKKLPGELIHRAIIYNQHESNPLCSEAKKGNPIMIASSALTEIEFPLGYAYPLLPSDPLQVEVVLQNETEGGFLGVTFELKLITKPMNEFVKMKDLKPVMVDLDPCEHKPIKIEKDEIVEKAKTFRIENASRLILANGILQDYGVTLAISKDTDPIPFWRAQAELDENYRIKNLENNPFIDPKGVAMKKGEAITFQCSFNNASKRWYNAAAAGAIMYLSEN